MRSRGAVGGAGAGHQGAEAVGIHLAVGHAQPVAGRLMDDAVAADGPAQLGDLGLEGARGLAGRTASPQLLHEPVGGHRAARMRDEVGQQRPDLRLGHSDLLPRLAPHHQWTEHSEPHANDRNPPH
ncbi:hypothetical protein GCM10020000_35310 [Streptomyces olivoverticillatus]